MTEGRMVLGIFSRNVNCHQQQKTDLLPVKELFAFLLMGHFRLIACKHFNTLQIDISTSLNVEYIFYLFLTFLLLEKLIWGPNSTRRRRCVSGV